MLFTYKICLVKHERGENKELAEKACVSRMTVSSVRSGKSVNDNSARHIARALGVELDALKEEV